MYYHPETGKIFTLHSQVRTAMPWVMFGDSISEQDLAEQGVFPVFVEPPSVDFGKIALPVAIESIDGIWTQLWSVRDATPAELDAKKPPVPREVTMRQARLALHRIGVLAQVAPAIEALEGDEREVARIEWEFSSTVMRDRPLVAMLGHALGLDNDALDQLFITAAGL